MDQAAGVPAPSAAAALVLSSDDLLHAILAQLDARSLALACSIATKWRNEEARSREVLWRALNVTDWPDSSTRWCKGHPARERYRQYARFLHVNVKLDLPASFLDGWTCWRTRHYNEFDPILDLHAPCPLVERATHVFIGAQRPDGTIAIGAVGERAVVFNMTEVDDDDALGDDDDALELTEDSRHLKYSHGVWWYFIMEFSFGFSSVPECLLNTADVDGCNFFKVAGGTCP